MHKLLLKCYPQRSTVPAPDTLQYTLGEFPINLVWTQEQTPEHSLHLNAMTGIEMFLSCEDKLKWITREDSTILAFLPLPDTGKATSSQSSGEMSDRAQPPGQSYARDSKLSNDLLQEGIPPSIHQIFVRIPDIWTEKGRKPTYTQTMPTPTSLDSLKEGLSLLLSIPTHSFRIQYRGKTLTNQVTLEAQGVTKGTTVWMIIGGLF